MRTRNQILIGLVVVSGMIVSAPELCGQEPGDSIRVRTADSWVRGALAGMDRWSVVVSTDTGRVSIPLDALEALEVQRPHSRWRNAGRGALWGLGIGAASGAFVGSSYQPFGGFFSRAEQAVYLGFWFGVGGAGTGVVASVLREPGTYWDRVPPPD